MEYQLTAVYHRVNEGYSSFVEELPGANTQGATLDETRTNLREAVELVIEANRALSEQDLEGAKVIRHSKSSREALCRPQPPAAPPTAPGR